MSVRVSAILVANAYTLLRETAPFRRWKLPPAENVKFKILHTPGFFGDYMWDDGHHVIRVSWRRHHQLPTLLQTVAHEMVHMRLKNLRSRDDGHGSHFWELARLVCRHHGFDPGNF